MQIDPQDLAAVAELDDQAAAAYLSGLVVTEPTYVFGSFRTLAAMLTQSEYNTLRAALNAAATAETAAGETLLADMVEMLRTPGNESGSGGGLDFASAGFVAMLSTLCTQANLPEVPGKVAAYVASQQPTRRKYPELHAGDIPQVRATNAN